MVEYYKIANLTKHASLNAAYPDLYDGVGSALVGESFSIGGAAAATVSAEGHSAIQGGKEKTLGLFTGKVGAKDTVGGGVLKKLKLGLFIDDIGKEKYQTQTPNLKAYKVNDRIASYTATGDVRKVKADLIAFTARQDNFLSEHETFTGAVNEHVGNDTYYQAVGRSLITAGSSPYLSLNDAEDTYRWGTDKGFNQRKGGGFFSKLDSFTNEIKKRHTATLNGQRIVTLETCETDDRYWKTKINKGIVESAKYFLKSDVQNLVKFETSASITELDEDYANAVSPNNSFFDSVSQGNELAIAPDNDSDKRTLIAKADATFSTEEPSGGGQQLKLHTFWSGTTDEAGTGAPIGFNLGTFYSGNHISQGGDAATFEDRQEVRLSYHTVPFPGKIFPDGWNSHPVRESIQVSNTSGGPYGGEYGDTQLPYSSVVSMKVNFKKLEAAYTVPTADRGSTSAEFLSVTKRAFLVTFGYFEPLPNESVASHIKRHAKKGAAETDNTRINAAGGYPFMGFSFLKIVNPTSTHKGDGILPISSDRWDFEGTDGDEDDYITDGDTTTSGGISGHTGYGAYGDVKGGSGTVNSGSHCVFGEGEYVNLDFHFSPDCTYCGLVIKDEQNENLKVLNSSSTDFYPNGFRDYHNEGGDASNGEAVFRSYNLAFMSGGLDTEYHAAQTTNTRNQNNKLNGHKFWDQFNAGANGGANPAVDRDYFGASGSIGLNKDTAIWPPHMTIWLCNWKNEVDADENYDGAPDGTKDFMLHAAGGLSIVESKTIRRGTESKVFIDEISFRNFNYRHQNASVCETNKIPQRLTIGGGQMVDALPMSFDTIGETSIQTVDDDSNEPQPWRPRDLGTGFQWPSNTILGFATNSVSGATSLNPGSTSSGSNQHHILLNDFRANINILEKEYTISDWDNSGSDDDEANVVTISLPTPNQIPMNSIFRWESSNSTFDDIAHPDAQLFTSSGDKLTWGTDVNTGSAVNNMTGTAYEIGPPVYDLVGPHRISLSAAFTDYAVSNFYCTAGDSNSINQTPAFGQQFSGMTARMPIEQNETNGICYYSNNKVNNKHANLVDNFTNKGGIQINGNLEDAIDHGVTVMNSTMNPELVRREHCAFSAKILKCINKSDGIYRVDTTAPFRVGSEFTFVAYLHGGAFTGFDNDLEEGSDTTAGGGGTIIKKNIKLLQILDNKHVQLIWGGEAEDGVTPLVHEDKLPYLWICPAAFYVYGIFPNFRGRGSIADDPYFITGKVWEPVPLVSYKSAVLLKATSGHTSAEGTVGATYNEFLYSDTPIVTGHQENEWSLDSASPNTILDVNRDFGFGKLDLDSEDEDVLSMGGAVGRTFGISTNSYNFIEMDNIFNAGLGRQYDDGEEDISFIVESIRDEVSHKIIYRTPSFSGSDHSVGSSNVPQLWTVYEDELPQTPKISIEPDLESNYYPKFNIEAEGDDLWYGMLLIDTAPIYDQYHSAVWRFGFKSLEEGGVHNETVSATNGNFYNAAWDKNFSSLIQSANSSQTDASVTNRGTRWYQTAKQATGTDLEIFQKQGDPKVVYDGLGGPAIKFDSNDGITFGNSGLPFYDDSLGGTLVAITRIDSSSGTVAYTCDRAHGLEAGDTVFILNGGNYGGCNVVVGYTEGTSSTTVFTSTILANGGSIPDVTNYTGGDGLNPSQPFYIVKTWSGGFGYRYDGTGEFTLLMHLIPDEDNVTYGYDIMSNSGSGIRMRSRDAQITVDLNMKRAARFGDGEATGYGHSSNSFVTLTGRTMVQDGVTPTMIAITVDPKLPEGNAKLYMNGALVDQTGPIQDPTTVQDNSSSGAGGNDSQPGWFRGYDLDLNRTINIGNYDGSGSGFKGIIEDVVAMNKCAYFVTPGQTELTLPVNLKDISFNGKSQNYNAKLFMKDYHNIQGKTPREVAQSPNISWSKAGFDLI